ncbi:hypothetical protein V4836_04770 [Kluyvera ascorbata]|uniref:Uncharacterized protein n=1 Tax=Kluyvera ascorbata TaxID=51288 RepID=A0AB35X619_9ENTR
MNKICIMGLMLFTVCSYADGKDISITASGTGINKLDACQTAKKALELQAIRGHVTTIGSCDCERNAIGQWDCAVNGTVRVK